jgi:hypothetical protein
MDKAWKRNERAIARRLSGERVPVTGRQRGDVPDVKHNRLAIECKHRKSLPAYLRDAIAQSQAAKRGDQLPIAILHESLSRHDDDLVVMRLSEFEIWLSKEEV